MLTFIPPTQVHYRVYRLSGPDPVHVVFVGYLHHVEVHVVFTSTPPKKKTG